LNVAAGLIVCATIASGAPHPRVVTAGQTFAASADAANKHARTPLLSPKD
jgi:hypothetical protein